MLRNILLTILAATTIAACNKDDDDNNAMNQTDRDFMMKASYGNHNEIGAGTVATQRGSNAAVKSFGQMMVTDHGTAETELTSLASQMSVSIPQTPDTPHMMMVAQLQTLSGMAFDSTYMTSQVVDHQTTIQLFQNEIANGSHPSVKSYAQKYLPKIQMHHMMADSIRMGL